MERPDSRHLAVVVGLLIGGLLAWPTHSAGQGAERIGTVTAVDGVAEVRAQDAPGWERLRFRDAVYLNDMVRTLANSKVKILLRDDSIMTLAEGSELQFTESLLTEQQRRTVVSLFVGKIRVLTTRLFGAGSLTEVHTPNAVAGVRGSEGHVSYATETRQTTVLPGSGDWYMSNPLDRRQVLDIPVGRAADQTGPPGLPLTTRQATTGERQAAVQVTLVTEQVKGEVQTTAEMRQEQAQEPPGPPRGEALGVAPPGLPPSTKIETGPVLEAAVVPPGTFPEALLTPVTAGLVPGADNPQLTTITPDVAPTAVEVIRNSLVQLTIKIPR